MVDEVTFVQGVYDALKDIPDGLNDWRGKLVAARIGHELGQRAMPIFPDDEPIIGRDIPEFLEWMRGNGEMIGLDEVMRFLEKPYHWATEYRQFKREARAKERRNPHLF